MAYPILYILMRTDMDSMNSGKGMAQACHAANQYVHDVKNHTITSKESSVVLDTWAHFNGYGTTVVLDTLTGAELTTQIKTAKNEGFFAAVTHDPTYPVRDGFVTHLIPVDTCGYIMVPDKDIAYPSILGELSLHH